MVSVSGGDFNVPFAVLGLTQVVSGLVAATSGCFRWPTDVAAAEAEVDGAATAPDEYVANGGSVARAAPAVHSKN